MGSVNVGILGVFLDRNLCWNGAVRPVPGAAVQRIK